MVINKCLLYLHIILAVLVINCLGQYYNNPYNYYPDYSNYPKDYSSSDLGDANYYKNRGFGENNYYDKYQRSKWPDDGLNIYGPSFGRHYGQPDASAHTHDNFDREKTRDEVISAQINPLPHAFNAGLRRGLPTLQHLEARYGPRPHPPRGPEHILGRPLLLLTNPSKR